MHKNQLLDCQARISPFIHRTPVLSSRSINEMLNAEVFFKCENFQKMGAFKMRGATNAIMKLSDVQRAKGVVTHSSGNFAQAVSLAAKSLDVKAHIVMPTTAPQVKINAVKGYQGQITMSEPTIASRQAAADEIMKSIGATFIHPSNDMDVIYGNATACMELLEDMPNLEQIVVPVGGGGLLAGTALAAHYFGTKCDVIAGEPKEVDDAYRSMLSEKIETNETTNTIADGLRTHLGDKNFPIIREHVKEIIRVEEEEIIKAMRLVWERMKIIIEPSSAVAIAALFKEKDRFRGKKIGVIISGGNVDIAKLPFNTIIK